MTKIILTRHGHVAGLHPERFRGRIELALTDEGLRQSKRTAAYIAAIWTPAAIYSSPLQRCLATAAKISRACGGIKVVVLKGLNDLDYGAWQ